MPRSVVIAVHGAAVNISGEREKVDGCRVLQVPKQSRRRGVLLVGEMPNSNKEKLYKYLEIKN